MPRSGVLAGTVLSLLSLHCVAPASSTTSDAEPTKDASAPKKPEGDPQSATELSGPAQVDLVKLDAGATDDAPAVDPNATHTVYVDVDGVEAPGLALTLWYAGARWGDAQFFPRNGRFLLYSFSLPEQQPGVELTGFPAAPYEGCTLDSPSGAAVFNGSDVILHLHCSDRFASVPSYAPSSALPFAMAGEPSNLAALDGGLTFAASTGIYGTVDGTSAVVAFDAEGHVTASDSLPFYVQSLARLGDTGLAYVAGVDPEESYLETQAALGAPTDKGGWLENACTASWSAEDSGVGFVEQPFDIDGTPMTRVAPSGALIDDGVTTRGGFSYVEQGSAYVITAASFSGDGLDVSIWSKSPFVITRMIHLSGLDTSSARPNTLSYAAGKVWIASVDASGITWRSYAAAL